MQNNRMESNKTESKKIQDKIQQKENQILKEASTKYKKTTIDKPGREQLYSCLPPKETKGKAATKKK